MNAFTSIFLFMFFSSGLLFVQRMLHRYHCERVLSRYALTKIGTLNLCLIVATVIFAPLRYSLLIICFLQIGMFAVTPVVTRFREESFKKNALVFIEDVLLGMKTGRAFRHAFDSAKSRCDAFTQQKLSEIMSHVAFSQQAQTFSGFARLLVDEFRHVDQKPHRAIHRLEVLRDRLRTEQDFRRRSGEATKQVQIQAVVLLILYIGLFAALSLQVRLANHSTIIAASLFLMLAGYILMWIILRRFQWKV